MRIKEFLRQHWAGVVGGAWVFPVIWQGAKWLLDWIGRLDVISAHYGEVRAMLDYVFTAPGNLILLVAGLTLIWWDLKRPRPILALQPEPSQQAAIVATAPDNRQWFTSHAIGHAGDESLVQAAIDASDRFGEIDRELEKINDEIDGLSSSITEIELLRGREVEPKKLRAARERKGLIKVDWNMRQRERAAAVAQAVDDIYERLRDGRVVAKGFLAPIEEGSQEVEIPAARWRFLRFNGDFTEASGEGITYKAVAVARRQ